MPTGLSKYTCAAIAFAREACADSARARHGERVRAAAARFLREIDTIDRGWHFDDRYARHACEFIEQMPHVEGVWPFPTVQLEPFQSFMLVQLFGFRKDSPMRGATIRLDGRGEPFRPRRVTSFLFACGRKNAKSTLGSGIGLYIQAFEPEPGQQLFSAATNFRQALAIFNVAKKMVERCRDLRERIGLQVFSKRISRPSAGSEFEPLHAKASTKDGLNPSCCLIDEVHAHPDGALISVLTSAAGARVAPLFAYFTTEGYLSRGPWAEIRGFADAVFSGAVTADHFLPVIFSVDKDDEDFAEDSWVKANPLMLTNPHLHDAVAREAIEAKGMPSKLAEFRVKRLNRPSNPADSWVDMGKWLACDQSPVTLDDFRGLAVYGGLDMSSTCDLAAFQIVAEHPERGLIIKGWKWVPGAAVAARLARGSVPYSGWVESGWLEEIEGDVIDQRRIRDKVIEIAAEINMLKLFVDPWNTKQTSGELLEAGVIVEEFVQGPKSYHPVMRRFEELYITGKVCGGGDPVLNWCIGNLIARRDVNLNMAPDKRRAPDKIDAGVATLMAMAGIIDNVEDAAFDLAMGDPLIG